MVHRLRLHTSHAGGAGPIPGQETKTSHAVWQKQATTTTTKKNTHKIFLKNRKLESKVFVMDKMKLAEYKLQNPKGQFVSEDKRKTLSEPFNFHKATIIKIK